MLRRKKRGTVVDGSKRGVVRREQRNGFPTAHVATFALERYEYRGAPVLRFERSVIPHAPEGSAFRDLPSPSLLAALLTAVAGLRSERSGELVGPGVLVGRRCKRMSRTRASAKLRRATIVGLQLRTKFVPAKNGHPTHVLTTEDRRKAAAVTNAIRRVKRLLRDQLRLNEEIERMMAADRAQRWPRRDRLEPPRGHTRAGARGALDSLRLRGAAVTLRSQAAAAPSRDHLVFISALSPPARKQEVRPVRTRGPAGPRGIQP